MQLGIGDICMYALIYSHRYKTSTLISASEAMELRRCMPSEPPELTLTRDLELHSHNLLLSAARNVTLSSVSWWWMDDVYLSCESN
jgi:hypothetical protein